LKPAVTSAREHKPRRRCVAETGRRARWGSGLKRLAPWGCAETSGRPAARGHQRGCGSRSQTGGRPVPLAGAHLRTRRTPHRRTGAIFHRRVARLNRCTRQCNEGVVASERC
jgi:hypothetical protein